MESKIQLFDADNNKIGETFFRRARQLVSQQRAEWTDGSQTAIRFAPDAETEWHLSPPEEEPVEKNEALYLLAENRLRERNYFILHTIVFPPGMIFIMEYGDAARAWEFAYFLFGCWLTLYCVHLYFFVKKRLAYSSKWQRKRLRKLENEMERIKSMGGVK